MPLFWLVHDVDGERVARIQKLCAYRGASSCAPTHVATFNQVSVGSYPSLVESALSRPSYGDTSAGKSDGSL